MFLHNDPKFKQRRKELRHNETKEEKFLWAQLRRKKLNHKFSRQYSIGPYILDFYCVELKLAIELDGFQHLENKDYDKERDDYLSLNGVKVLRFWNSELNDNINNVLKKITSELTFPHPSLGGGQEGV